MTADFRTLLKRERATFFIPIEVGQYILSIQASQLHYSKPRSNLINPMGFHKFEVGVLKDHEWELFKPGDPLSDGPWMEYAERDYYEGMENNVLGYVPTEIVQKLYERVLELSQN